MQSPFCISFNPGVMTTDGDLQYITKVPSGWGGYTVLGANFVNGAATTGGTSFFARLVNYGTSGTVVGGTIGTIGGTADHYAADTPKAFTITAAQAFLDEGEWLVLRKDQDQADSDINAQAVINIWLIPGIISQG